MEQPITQYTDVHGAAAADFHDPTSLQRFAQAGGVDTTRYFPVELELYGETGLALSKIYAVDTLKAGGNTFQAVHAYLQANPGDVEVFECAGPEIIGFIKRLDVVLGYRDLVGLI